MENRRVASSADIEPSASDFSPQKEKKKKNKKKLQLHWQVEHEKAKKVY